MLTEESFSKANYWLIFIIIYNDYMHKIEVKHFNIFLIWHSSKYIQGVSDLFMSQGLWVMVFNATFNNLSAISWWSVLLVEEIRVPGENHWSVTSHWQIYHIMLYRVHLEWNFNSQPWWYSWFIFQVQLVFYVNHHHVKITINLILYLFDKKNFYAK